MDYIYIETKPGKYKEFVKLLEDYHIGFNYIGCNSIMIHKQYFIILGRFLSNEMINSFASKVESL